MTANRSKEYQELVKKTEDYVSKELATVDGSHDWWHIHRVRKLALEIAQEENIKDLLVIELAALLHDIKDWKYSANEKKEGPETIAKFLASISCPNDIIDAVVYICSNIGYKNQLTSNIQPNAQPQDSKTNQTHPHSQDSEDKDKKYMNKDLILWLQIVQDADRLDAMGAIGVARCFTYGGAKNRTLYDPDCPPVTQMTKEVYMKQSSTNTTCLNHFYEKLFLLKDRINTKSGKKIAQQRHDFMVTFVQQFLSEWNYSFTKTPK